MPLAYQNLPFFSHRERFSAKQVDYQALFSALDLDSAGYITTAKVCHIMANLGLATSDGLLDEMLSNFDEDGDGNLTFPEFVKLVNSLGCSEKTNELDGAGPETYHPNLFESIQSSSSMNGQLHCENLKRHVDDSISLDGMPYDVKNALKSLDFSEESKVYISDLERAARLLQAERSPPTDPEDNPFLHWSKGREKRGLGGLVYKANHIALIVKDVGRSAAFYNNVLGFQQIRRPNFDRYGAWFTMGNIELHLIKGVPVVPSGDDLIVGHISIETNNIDQVPGALRKLGVPFQQNVSVPRAADAGQGTNESNTSDEIVKQYFVRDPDGYFIEICNCDVLTDYCLVRHKDESETKLPAMGESVQLQSLLQTWADSAEKQRRARVQEVNGARTSTGSPHILAKLLGYNPNDTTPDESKLKNLFVRRTVYGDICQNETEESLTDVLISSGNDVPKASHLMKLKALAHGTRKLRPPPFYENGKQKVIPPPIQTVAEF